MGNTAPWGSAVLNIGLVSNETNEDVRMYI